MEVNSPKKLLLTNWVGGEWFGRQGINFDVLEEDGQPTEQKQFTITSRRLIMVLKPILMQAEDARRDTIAVTILRMGDGLNTRYKVDTEVPINE